MRIVARLPLGDRTKNPPREDYRALVVARLKFEPSGDDRSFIALDLDKGISRAKLSEKAGSAGMNLLGLHSVGSRNGDRTLHLLETGGYVAQGDNAVASLVDSLGTEKARAVAIGGYPTPPVYDDKVGKGAES